MQALAKHNRNVVNKPRQCYASSACISEALRRVEYWPGHNGLVIADKAATSTVLFDRVLTTYRHQDGEVKVPAESRGLHGIRFAHGGSLRVTTAGAHDPGVGNSIDFLHASEFGSWKDGTILSKVMPALIKRPHSRAVIESTPGPHGSTYHEFWLDSLSGKTGWNPVFIAWWEHDSYALDGSDLIPTDAEEELLRTYPAMTRGHLAFRRKALSEQCNHDERLFARSYPYDPYSGWITDATPALPEEPLRALMPGLADPGYLQGWEGPQPGHHYIICADPNSYGSTGDPSAYTIIDASTRTEVGAWSGRIDPVKFGQDLAKLGKRYNNAVLVIESNAAACVTALVQTRYTNVWQNAKDNAAHPGWYRTAPAKQRAIAALVHALHDRQLIIKSREGLTQLLGWDGVDSRTDGHHWDRVVTYQIAADVLSLLRVPPIPAPRLPLRPGFARVSDLMRDDSPRSRRL